MQFLTTLAAIAAAISTTLAAATPDVEASDILYCGTQPYKVIDVCTLPPFRSFLFAISSDFPPPLPLS